MPGRGCGHAKRGTVGGGDLGARPGREPGRAFTKTRGSCLGRDDAPGSREQVASGSIEVVEVMVVAQQDGIDPAQLTGGERRILRLSERVARKLVHRAGRIEGRIGKQSHPTPLE
jgi:hypothetical protein